jgi:hypothetical protein
MTTRPRFLGRTVLPVVFLILSITLAKLGEARRDRFMQSVLAQTASMQEPLPEAFATERYVDCALNAPAWAAMMKMLGLRVRIARRLGFS